MHDMFITLFIKTYFVQMMTHNAQIITEQTQYLVSGGSATQIQEFHGFSLTIVSKHIETISDTYEK